VRIPNERSRFNNEKSTPLPEYIGESVEKKASLALVLPAKIAGKKIRRPIL
jgi:hypothetical protein